MNISALIPTYNRRTQVLRAIQSVLSQTVPVGEIIVVDDGSTDGTVEAIRERYGLSVSVFRQENAGVSAARNRAIREARGEWVAFLDSDDEWLPSKIERQVDALKALGSEFGLCFTDCIYDEGKSTNNSVFQQAKFAGSGPFGRLDDPAEYLLGPANLLSIQSTLVLRSLVEDIKGFDEGIRIMEDLDAFFRLTFKTKFCFVSDPLMRIDRNPGRTNALCELFATRDDRKYDDLRRIHTRWLEMPEVIGSKYENPIRKSLRLLYYESVESNIRGFKAGAALREIARLRALKESYGSIVLNLASRKIRKLRRDIRASLWIAAPKVARH